ncbi:MAG TPA: double zinc ribbon domain-containing protein [Gaiellaceae bacterium]|nr:double zinc ribbon domain-containing protein [Gaiellaceae bacterium]
MLGLLLPQRCVVCGDDGRQLCAGCRGRLAVLEPPLCARCGAPTAWPVERCLECAGRRLAFATARAAVGYDDAARRLVHAWKERGLRRLAAEAAQIVAERLPPPRVDALAFVPAEPTRRLVRGHNPAERLARELGAAWGLPCLALLERARGGRQRGRSAAERRRLRGAFAPAGMAPGRVALVDDVYTTGATASAAASALRAAGARRVEAITFARALRRGGSPPRRPQ